MDVRDYPFRGRTLSILILDLALITGVLSVGLFTHGINPVDDLHYTVYTVGPFWIGWVIVAPLIGGYAPRVIRSAWASVAITAVAWAVAVMIGGFLRSTFTEGSAPFIFILVTMGSGYLVLLPWRVLVAHWENHEDNL